MNKKNRLFTIARLKLSLLYAVIILAITGTISGLVFWRVSYTLNQQYEHFRTRLFDEARMQGPGKELLRKWQLSQEDLEQTKLGILHQILIFNGSVALLVVFFGYYLSGKTLKPIQDILEQQKRFISDAAHELRTPITALKAGVEADLLDKSLPVKTKDLLKSYLEDTQSLEHLAEQLLSLAKNETAQYQCREVNLNSLVRKVIKKMSALAKQSGLSIQLEAKKENIKIYSCPTALSEVITILLDNAIKYSDKGKKIEIFLEEKNRQLIIKIKDQGIGIAQEHLPYIFDRFYRANQARTRHDRSVGLGLAIARAIVEKLRGQISVKSQINKSTTFTIALPKK